MIKDYIRISPTNHLPHYTNSSYHIILIVIRVIWFSQNIEFHKLLSYITSACVGDESWRGNTEIFILNLQEQFRLYDKLVESSDHFYGVHKCTMLENVFDTISYIQAIKTQADQLKTRTGIAPIYDNYSELLISDAMNHDKKFKQGAKFGSKYRRNVYDIEELPNDDYGDSFCTDSSVDMIQEYDSQHK